ncbi:PREDICTED: F-box/kelch-repeat protein At1g57790-like [Erythranthe guttata]|nr:PREDICTED: F-box/kelch-repeat protein At1g57790-like [Erythranthe guttata]|eukprot:XP_012829465.1 PREDICTED: F-box/kelch-repeat protein At1g57790-like [Erythranthe guttata]
MDWNNLPQDLVDLILSKVFAKDRHNFSLVCRSWNTVVAASPFRHSPCLMFNQRKKKHVWKLSQNNNFFYMEFPQLQGGTIRFANHGWLLISRGDDETLFFYHPFNHHMIEVPSPSDSNCAGYTTICFFHPPTSPDCFVVGIVTQLDQWSDTVDIGVLKHGEDKWENCTYQSQIFQSSIGPPILHGGLVYFLDTDGDVATFDIREHGSLSSWKVFPDCLPKCLPECLEKHWSRKCIKEHYFIKPKGEETIFAVFAVHGEREVKVYSLSETFSWELVEDLVFYVSNSCSFGYTTDVRSKSTFSWELVEDLGDRVFYVSNSCSFGYTTDVRSKSMKNKIFFPKFHGDNVVYYSLDTHKYHSFEGGYSCNNPHGLKKLNFATWIMPGSTDTELPKESLEWCPKLISES